MIKIDTEVFNVHICMGWYTYIYFHSDKEWPVNNDTSVTASTGNAQILVSKHLSPLKGTRGPRRSG